MARVVVVVARDRPDLFSYFDTVFAGMPDVKVLLDRRLPDGDGADVRSESLSGGDAAAA